MFDKENTVKALSEAIYLFINYDALKNDPTEKVLLTEKNKEAYMSTIITHLENIFKVLSNEEIESKIFSLYTNGIIDFSHVKSCWARYLANKIYVFINYDEIEKDANARNLVVLHSKEYYHHYIFIYIENIFKFFTMKEIEHLTSLFVK